MPISDPRRHLPIHGTRNVRDVGGYPTADGRRTRWRTLLRSDELTQLPAHAIDELCELGLRQVIDLRWPNELELSPSVFAGHPDVRYRHIALLVDDPTPHSGLAGMYRHVLDERLPQLVEVVRALLEPDGLPAVIGCAAGKDRTGITIAVLLSLAGVSDDLVIKDYALSAGYFSIPNATIPPGDWRHQPLVVDSPPEFMASAIDHLHQAHGGARELLRSGGLDDDELDTLVGLLTEPARQVGRISASVALPYPPALVFRVATRVEDLPRWMPEVVSAELLDPTLAVGSRARLRLSSAAAGAEVVAAITQLDPPSRLVMNGSGGPLGVAVSVSLRATESGGTDATVEMELTTPPFLGFVAREAERKLDAGLPGALERLRALIEAEPA